MTFGGLLPKLRGGDEAFRSWCKVNSYDIFKKCVDGKAVWIGTVASLYEGRSRLAALFQTDPSEYYVCDLLKKAVLAAITPDHPQLHTDHLERSRLFNAGPSE